MIYWFTGQPGHGKTVLAKMLKEYIEHNHQHKEVFHIDGDDLREILINKDYSKEGRENNIRTAQSIAIYLDSKRYDVIVSLVAPYRKLREELKSRADVCEIYVHTTESRERDHFKVQEYEHPLENFIDIDTTIDTPSQSLNKITKQLDI